MNLRIPLLLLASAILLTPRPSVSEPTDFLTSNTCAATSSSPEVPVVSQAESESLPKAPGPILRPKCGACGQCQGFYAGDQCGVASNGQLKYCSDKTEICSQDGLARCVCDIWLQ